MERLVLTQCNYDKEVPKAHHTYLFCELLIYLIGSSILYGAHSVPKPFNRLIHLANKIKHFSVFNKITL